MNLAAIQPTAQDERVVLLRKIHEQAKELERLKSESSKPCPAPRRLDAELAQAAKAKPGSARQPEPQQEKDPWLCLGFKVRVLGGLEWRRKCGVQDFSQGFSRSVGLCTCIYFQIGSLY